VPFRALVLAALAACALTARADPSPCDDVNYARDFRARYPTEVNRVFDAERKQQEAWSARAKAIGDRVVLVGAATRDAQDAVYQALSSTPQMAALGDRANKAGEEFRLRNDTLVATPPLAKLDPLRPNRAWCILATQALQSLNDKLSAETEAWSTLDRALLAAAASRGVQFAN
jgi:hypothetical protein